MTFDTDLITGFLEDAEGAIARGAMSQARALYQGILSADETNQTALTQLAALAFAEEDYQRALSFYAFAVEHYSRDADIHHGLGAVLWKLGDHENAERSFNTAIRIEPNHEPALYDKARLLQTTGRVDAAEQLYLQLASQNMSRVDAMFNRGVIMFRKGNLVAADRWFRQAAKRDPYSPRPVINLALIYRYWGRLDDAHRCLTHVVEQHPDLVDGQWNLANLELLQGNLKDGFARKEWRFKRDGFTPPVRDIPRWQGGDIEGGALLLVAEQGLGDTIHMVRFAKILADKGFRIGVEAQTSLAPVLKTVPGVAEVVAPGTHTDDYGAWLPIMSLPAVLGIVEETIPASIPYMSVPSATPTVSLEKKKFTVGIVWCGNPKHETDHLRSIPLVRWSPVLDVPDVEFVSIQVGTDGSELASVNSTHTITDASEGLTDFSHTAAWVAHLDLIISVDTATAHLAAAMGRPTWLLISPANDWRWMTGRSDSPWYPTLRLFRAKNVRIWTDVMYKVAEALAERVSKADTLDQSGVPDE
ncbi:MAG: tetratricopeptide repeat protein [Alphaproteobacteria bacterium]|nr:tetratricopeptide repeat protein [Alphaproteobacteria bacterium]